MRRAAHQLVDVPLVFEDPLALPILGHATAGWLEANLDRENNRVARALRAFMAVRSRFAEDALANAVGRGVGSTSSSARDWIRLPIGILTASGSESSRSIIRPPRHGSALSLPRRASCLPSR